MPIEPASKNGPHQGRSEKVVGTYGAGQQTAPCSEKAQVSPMQLQWSQMRAVIVAINNLSDYATICANRGLVAEAIKKKMPR